MSVPVKYNEAKDTIRFLVDSAEASAAVYVEETARKALLLGVASFFEKEVCTIITEFADRCSNGNVHLGHLIRNKVISRQYHTFFDWKQKSVNSFFTMFGADVAKIFQRDRAADQSLDQGAKDFVDIGSIRNQLAHEDFVSFPLDKSLDDIYRQYESGLIFIKYIKNILIDLRNDTPINRE